MTFKDIETELKLCYNSANDDIINTFYNKVLSEAVNYDRISGFFNSTSLAVAAYGMTNFLKNNGHMRLICGVELDSDDIESIRSSDDLKDYINTTFLNDYENLENEFIENHVKLLGWMIANNYLEIKIGVIKKQDGTYSNGILHSKIGLLYDVDGDIILFDGSVNETAFGWKKNIESLKIFYSWINPEYMDNDIKDFDDYWNNKHNSIMIMDIPKATKNKLIKIAPKNYEELNLVKNNKTPILRDYQKQALDKWINNNYKGIFSMATGTGKTITALYCWEHLNSNKKKLFTIIVCPQKHLITQWESNLELFDFNGDVIIADGDNPKWKLSLLTLIADLNSNLINNLVVITTFNTFSNEHFINIVKKYDGDSFLIVDEVHGIGSFKYRQGLLDCYTYRLGLSATPEIEDDFERTDIVFDYFNYPIFEYDINKAIENGFLTPYNYFPEFIDLTTEELEKYGRYTIKIAQLLNKKNMTLSDEKSLNNLLRNRRNIINNAEAKLIFIKNFLSMHTDIKDTIIYCCDKSQLELVEEILNELNISFHRFTGDESTKKDSTGKSERDKILALFAKGHYSVLVAIKCLDEGVDVPSTKTAVLLSSTLNTRQHIQRRGRILRKSHNKRLANIYDLIVFPSIDYNFDMIKSIILNEQKRYDEYAKLAKNYVECSEKLLKKWGLN